MNPNSLKHPKKNTKKISDRMNTAGISKKKKSGKAMPNFVYGFVRQVSLKDVQILEKPFPE